ncbi:N-6 DNA methylase [Oleiagrimonas sp. MCCC 1A03011]|uniref:HsdM family class I SAM-dependent methyltransferase n=1 Tax=Oleiagrimonas sp. MCCC 1A03011 TaxID=1926883 RepID=UPI000DC55540|nr:N-6 DNA methylase [Oleiagrimonas sp. MCCC 1A03011]RAP59669.1 hypothetical protein BTJ49_03240 [Oleiagrimonas sp. MCCC 1A03011]
MNTAVQANLFAEILTPLERFHACKAMARGYAQNKANPRTRLSHARAFCAEVLMAYWRCLCRTHKTSMKAKRAPTPFVTIAKEARNLAHSLGELISIFPTEDAGFLMGSVYTGMLPPEMRSQLGAYYTPPPLVARLLDMAEAAGFDFKHGTVIDPACGGGAFLAPVALRMVEQAEGASPSWLMRRLGKRLRGIEIDPFAAWMTSVLLDAALMPISIQAGRRLDNVVEVADSLEHPHNEKYDLVVGNPPYGRITLPADKREKFARSLYGHANLYGLFTDLALGLVKGDGVVAYLTPTSFLGGQYFKALRQLLLDEVTPVAFDFVADREGVFDDVLQETLLAAYTKKDFSAAAQVSVLVPEGLNAAHIESVAGVRLEKSSEPWLLPRNREDTSFFENLASMPTRLGDLGYTVSTGPLVWNRHKDQLKTTKSKSTLPIIWAESVTTRGFAFSADKRGHVPYIALKAHQDFLKTDRPVVLVQRTTSKEQARRLVAAELDADFVSKNGGVVVENHLNMVVPTNGAPLIGAHVIAALLNTSAVDRAFRCISGSVAVSAYELNAVPMPGAEALKALEKMMEKGMTHKALDEHVSKLYGGSQ